MADNLYRSVQGAPYAPVATNPPAGVRSLNSEPPGYVPPRLGRWAIVVRLAVSAACFAGGFLSARVFVECLLGDTRMCSCVLPTAPFPVALVLGLAVLCAVSFLTLAKTCPTAPRAALRRAFLWLRNPLPVHSTGVNHG